MNILKLNNLHTSLSHEQITMGELEHHREHTSIIFWYLGTTLIPPFGIIENHR